ncbi:transposase [Shouchella sp. JSM 1781072]|uniref:transposase n=1 Tax=Bacillaceae TaxID=186817 RepID=UPI00114533D6
MEEQRMVYLQAGDYERSNEEIRRQETVIRMFSNKESANRFIDAVLMNIHKNGFGSTKKYSEWN